MASSDEPTRPIRQSDGDPLTQPVGGGRGNPERGRDRARPSDATGVVGGQRSDVPEACDPMRDPVVAWLVIVDGVGKGSALPLGYGQNSVGRGDNARVRMLFGGGVIYEGANLIVRHADAANFDPKVSRVHFIVTYDVRGRKFYLQGSPESKNLTYLKLPGDERPVLQVEELSPYARVLAGDTELMFVPLCHSAGDNDRGFDWQG